MWCANRHTDQAGGRSGRISLERRTAPKGRASKRLAGISQPALLIHREATTREGPILQAPGLRRPDLLAEGDGPGEGPRG
jgi:hypothetical protein